MLLIAFSFLGHTSIKIVFPGKKIMRKVFRLDTVTIKNPLTENSVKIKARDIILLGVQAEF